MTALVATKAEAGPRFGFIGVGWIGRNRMEAIAGSGQGVVAAVCDASDEMVEAALAVAPAAVRAESLDELLHGDLDAIVIATPSALHASQAIAALDTGHAVFCQKPVGRDAGEVANVIAAAQRSDRLFLADFSYRHTAAAQALRSKVTSGELGRIFALDLVFHNAYGPDKSWFYDPALSGGGCVADLGVHLVDLALWLLEFPEISEASGVLFANGSRLSPDPRVCEDYAEARIVTVEGIVVRMTCSWKLHAGQDAEIHARIHGTEGSVDMSNCNGSFYDFRAGHGRGTQREVLVEPPDAWGGRAAVDFARRLACNGGFDRKSEDYLKVAAAIDQIYGR